MNDQQHHTTDLQSLLQTVAGLSQEQQQHLVQTILAPNQYNAVEAAALNLNDQDRSRLIKALMVSQAQLPQGQMETAIALDKRMSGG